MINRNRICIVAVAVLLIVWQGGCMYWDDGALVNRCGLWQWWTGHAIVISLDDVLNHTTELPPELRQRLEITPSLAMPQPPQISVIVPPSPSMSLQAITGTMAFATATMGMTSGTSYYSGPPMTCSNSSTMIPGGSVYSTTNSSTSITIQNSGSGVVCFYSNGAGQ